jgi:hypothetical protein
MAGMSSNQACPHDPCYLNNGLKIHHKPSTRTLHHDTITQAESHKYLWGALYVLTRGPHDHHQLSPVRRIRGQFQVPA